jgi:hypothetical protein
MKIHNPATKYRICIPEHTVPYPKRHAIRFHVISGNVISKARPILRRFSWKSQMIERILWRLLITNNILIGKWMLKERREIQWRNKWNTAFTALIFTKLKITRCSLRISHACNIVFKSEGKCKSPICALTYRLWLSLYRFSRNTHTTARRHYIQISYIKLLPSWPWNKVQVEFHLCR